MSYSVSEQRKQTMLKRIGEAAALIDNQSYLPWFRSAQIMLEKMGKPEEWGKMIEVALTKDEPSKYFAKLCQRVKEGTYKFVEKVKEAITGATLWIDDKLVKYGFGKYHSYWRRKAQEFANINGQVGLVALLDYADRKKVSQKYLAKSLLNGKPPRQFYEENVIGGAK